MEQLNMRYHSYILNFIYQYRFDNVYTFHKIKRLYWVSQKKVRERNDPEGFSKL